MPEALEPFPELNLALAQRVLADVPPDVLQPLIEFARIEHLPAGAMPWRVGDPPKCGLVVIEEFRRVGIRLSNGRGSERDDQDQLPHSSRS